MLSAKYQRRLVAANDARACFVCYKPTAVVLVNEVQGADHFYICDAHLGDANFATADASAEQGPPIPPKPAIEQEIAKLRKEWETVRQSKADKDDKKEDDASKKDDAKKAESKPKVDQEEPAKAAPKPRWYNLNKGVLSLRIQAKRRVIQSKKTAQMLATPNLFPSVPTHAPGVTPGVPPVAPPTDSDQTAPPPPPPPASS